MSDDALVLVSGASGFVATHVVKLLQEKGYRVRGTVRSVKDEKKVKHLHDLCPNAKHKLELVEADLLDADSWKEAVKGCTYIQHVASPFPIANPRHEDEVIKPAVEGTLNVFRAAAETGTVKRIVLTSSTIAVAAGGGNTTPYSEKDWADDKAPGALAYLKSKIRAERAAWDFVKELPADKKIELAVVNPTLVIGPPLHGNAGSSTDIMKRLLERQMPAVPRFNFVVIDVRDVALAHLKCMTMDEAVGYNVPTKQLPGCLLTVIGWFDKSVRSAKEFATKEMLLDTTRMRDVLGIDPIDVSKSFIDMGYAMIDNGFVKKTQQYRGRPGGS